MNSNNWDMQQARWLWLGDESDEPNQYVNFRRVFTLQSLPRDAYVDISVDSDYELYINGSFAGWNQYPSWPKKRSFNRHDVSDFLKEGENCIAVRAYYRGEDFQTYAKGRPGFIFGLKADGKTVLCSDASWKCRKDSCYVSGKAARVTPQLGFIFEYDASKEDGWMTAEYCDSQWDNALSLCGPTEGYWESLEQRALPQLLLEKSTDAEVISIAKLIRQSSHDTIAMTMMEDFINAEFLTEDQISKGFSEITQIKLPADNGPLVLAADENADGIAIIIDLGRETAGLLSLDVTASVGTVLDIAHGEHLDNLRVRAHIGGRNFADRYICRQGRQQFVYPLRRFGCRYLEVHITNMNEAVEIRDINLKPVNYPFDKVGDFSCSDSKLNDIWRVGERTLELCAHEHYEDCPWREQALYGYDGRLQALYGFYCYSNYEFPRQCWDLLAGGIRDDGLLEMNAPAKLIVNIPGFTFHWISALAELYLYSGKIEYASKHLPLIKTIIQTALKKQTDEGLIGNYTNSDCWHFYEWTEGMAGDVDSVIKGENKNYVSIDAPFNLIVLEALRNAAVIAESFDAEFADSCARQADVLAQAIDEHFWDEQEQLYFSFIRDDKPIKHYSQFVQAMAIMARLGHAENNKQKLADKLMTDRRLIEAEYPSLYYVYSALLKADANNMNYVLEHISEHFGNMLYQGATSLWEARGGGDAFDRAGSLCHAWSSILNYIGGAHVAGVTPLKPGFTEFVFAPKPGGLFSAEAVIPTPAGNINAGWVRRGNIIKAKVDGPQSLKMKIQEPEGYKIEL